MPRLLESLRDHALLVVAVLAVFLLVLLGLPQHVSQDTWLALVAGRQIAEHGVPSHDYFTHMAYGVRWTDQQWLVQLLMYELERIGGIQLLTIVYVALLGGVFGSIVVTARALGGEPLHILMALPPGAFFFIATAVAVRGQGFVYPLFVAVLWLLAREFPHAGQKAWRAPAAWQAYCVLPLLVLWGNLHGSATMGVAITVLYGVALASQAIGARGARGLLDRRAWSFVILPPLTLLVGPYGFGIVHYYRATLGNSEFSRLVTEWQPVYKYPVFALALAIVALACAILLWRVRRRTPLFDLMVLALMTIAAFDAVRNIAWFGLATMMLMPAAITALHPDRLAPLRRSNLNLGLAAGIVALAILTTVVVASRPTSWFEREYPAQSASVVEQLAQARPNVKIFADVRYADWLIWKYPNLAGRVAYDASLELLTKQQLEEIAVAGSTDVRKARPFLERYPIWVLNPGNKAANRKLLKAAGVERVIDNKKIIVAIWQPPDQNRK